MKTNDKTWLLDMNDMLGEMANGAEYFAPDGRPIGFAACIVSLDRVRAAGLEPLDVPNLHVIDPATDYHHTLGAYTERAINDAFGNEENTK